jgi:hypothetical protein
MGEAANIRTERGFRAGVLTKQASLELAEIVHERTGLLRLGPAIVGMAIKSVRSAVTRAGSCICAVVFP